MVTNPFANARDIRDVGLIPVWRRSPGGGHSNPFQYSCLENPHGQRSLAGYSPWGGTESDTTGQPKHSIACLLHHTLKTAFITNKNGSTYCRRETGAQYQPRVAESDTNAQLAARPKTSHQES